MTRINTNVSSLIAQNVFGRNNASLQQALTRLGTGLRINSGKDDPAGLIAAEIIRSDIVAVEKAISNTERANQVIGTADSGLGQVAGLLNDIRGLVTESANSGALSEEQIEANQIQVDSALEALNRIAQTTTFQGKRLLDGSLEFIVTEGTNFTTIEDLNVDQANLGATGQLDVDIDISAAATRASLTNASATVTNANATAQLVFAAQGRLSGFASGAGTIDINAPGAQNGVTVQFTSDAALESGDPTAVYDADAATLTITTDNTVTATLQEVADAINSALDTNGNATDFVATVSVGNETDAFDFVTDGGITDVLDADLIDVTFQPQGPDLNDVSIEIATQNGLGATPVANYDTATRTLTVTVDDTVTTALADIATAIQGLTEVQTAVATASSTGIGAFDGTIDPAVTNDTGATANTDKTGGGVITDDLVFELSGFRGAEIFQFQGGTTISQIAAAINLVSDATGVQATDNNGTLEIESVDYGSKAFVDIEVIEEGGLGTFRDGLASTRANGTDIVATINGTNAVADGNTFSINTATLDVSLTVNPGSDADIDFNITGGGALFQIGPDVVSNQQARIGVGSVNAGSLGGVNGRLYQLAKGGVASLKNDPNTAARIIKDAINKVATLRGRLGSFQRLTLETNSNTLKDTVVNLTDAESSIRDADFAKETAALTRAQVLVQSGTAVLRIANQNPQNVLALLG